MWSYGIVFATESETEKSKDRESIYNWAPKICIIVKKKIYIHFWNNPFSLLSFL